jgi:hypothetical protein
MDARKVDSERKDYYYFCGVGGLTKKKAQWIWNYEIV